jgi:hypothetical protein
LAVGINERVGFPSSDPLLPSHLNVRVFRACLFVEKFVFLTPATHVTYCSTFCLSMINIILPWPN